jgi:hypothetical protein
MKELLADIKVRLLNGEYKNEEQVRLSLVARVLQGLGWNIWNPIEVNTEFVVVPNEDNKKVDVALFLRPFVPSVFIEIKAVGQMQGKLTVIEQQMRNYNRDNQAMFTVITDGRSWRFYFSFTGGEFSRRCFETFDLLDDDIDEVEASLSAFLRKTEIENENARRKAENYLQLNQIQRTAEDSLPDARRLITEPPYPSLPEALIQLVKDKGHALSHEAALKIIQQATERKPILTPLPSIPSDLVEDRFVPRTRSGAIREQNPDRPENLTHTKIIQGNIGKESITNWSDLVDCAVKTALKMGVPVQDVRTVVNLEQGDVNERGFHRIRDTAYSGQGMESNKSWRAALHLAKKTNLEIQVRFQWRDKEDAAHPGEEGLLRWSPSR